MRTHTPGGGTPSSAAGLDLILLRPGLWSLETPVEDFHVRGVVVAGTRRAVVWDTLAAPDHMAGVAEMAPDLPLTVVYSHGDWDHVWGTAGLSRPWTEILAHEACLARFSGDLSSTPSASGTPGKPVPHPGTADSLPRTLEEKRAAFPGEYDQVVLIPPTRTIRDTASLDLGGVTLEIHPLPGHTPDSLVGFVPEWGVFLAGDAVETPLPFLNPGSPVEVWAVALEGWARKLEEWERGLGPPAEIPPGWAEGGTVHPLPSAAHTRTRPGNPPPLHSSLVIPSHGPVGGPALLRRNALYLRTLLAGGEPELSPDLPPFYLQTHQANRTLVRREQNPGTGDFSDQRPGGRSEPPPGRKDEPCP
jgi:glyoxylase-like metal-dependent hydrolase (beta-lactamase superfamily II)